MVDRPYPLIQHITHTVLLACVVQASLWTVDIDNGPAPSPEDGPPLSLYASRNSGLLPGQICGIIGAYLATVFILGSLLLTVGRRMRRAALSAYLTTSMEMVKPSVNQFDDSPLSPHSQRSWYSPRRLKKRRSIQGSTRTVSNPSSPAVQSIASFDPGVLESDRVARQQELEHLYAAALAQEAAKSRAPVVEHEVPLPETTSPRSRRQPPRLLTSAPALAHLHEVLSERYILQDLLVYKQRHPSHPCDRIMDKRPRLQNHECQHRRAQRPHVHGHLHLVLKPRANVPEREFVTCASNTVIIRVKCPMKKYALH
jgi:hypothetical protein